MSIISMSLRSLLSAINIKIFLYFHIHLLVVLLMIIYLCILNMMSKDMIILSLNSLKVLESLISISSFISLNYNSVAEEMFPSFNFRLLINKRSKSKQKC